MKRLWSVSLCLMMFIGMIFPNLNVRASSGDTSPPVLNSLAVSPKKLNVGETLEVTAIVTDDASGVQEVLVAFMHELQNSTGESRTISLQYDTSKQLWIGKYTIKETDINGIWKINGVTATDREGNYRNIVASDIPNNQDLYYEVNNPDVADIVDVTPPTLESISLSQTKLELGQSLTIKVKADDTQSKVVEVYARLMKPDGNFALKAIIFDYDKNTGYWVGSYQVNPYDLNGKWKIGELQIRDALWNSAVFTEKELKESGVFEINNPSGGDGTPPVMHSIEFFPRVVNVGDTVTIKSKASDDFSGIGSGTVFVIAPSGKTNKLISLYDRDRDGVFEGSYKVNAVDEEGLWCVERIYFYDRAANYNYVNLADLPFFDELNFQINHSGESPITGNCLKVLDKVAPAKPLVNPVTEDDHEISGTAEPGATIILRNKDKGILYTGKVDGSGFFKIAIDNQTVGTIFTLTVSDKAGNVSDPVIFVIRLSFVPFDDVYQYKDEIEFLAKKGIIPQGGNFYPKEAITRLESLQMILKIKGITDFTAPDPLFSDIKKGDSGFEEVAKAVELGIISGKIDGKTGSKFFDPDGTLTRGQMTKILSLAFNIPAGKTLTFKDVKPTDWYYPYVSGLVADGMVKGYNEKEFKPNLLISREHFGVILARYMKKL